MTIKINFKGVYLIVDYDYQPAERATWQDPGCAESVEVHVVSSISGDDLTELFADEWWHDIEEKTLEAHISNERDYAGELMDKEWEE